MFNKKGDEISFGAGYFVFELTSINQLPIPNSLEVFTSDGKKENVYSFRLRVHYSNSPSVSGFIDFSIQVLEFCVPNSVSMTTDFTPDSLTYTVAQASIETATFAPIWTTDPPNCILKYTMAVKTYPAATYDPSVFVFAEDLAVPEMTVQVSTDEVYFNGDYLTGTYTPGSYTIEVRAFTDNDIDTGYFKELAVTIVDPCKTAVLTVRDDMALKALPDPSML